MTTTVKKLMVIYRGISGSGKSTHAKANYPGGTYCSADDEFISPETGKYVFDRSQLGAAHLACWQKAHEAVMRGDETVVIDNTNTQLWEMSPYVQMGQAMGYEVLIVRLDTPVEVAAKRNLHDVPLLNVRSMAERFQKVLPHWREVVVKGI